ncbi:3-phosphoshikimate 1-carboxyvinyltransferase [candidate division KSB1 bacterium]
MAAEIHLQEPLGSVRGELDLPGDKSISHRALILGALAKGTTTVGNLAPGEDVHSTRACLENLGVGFRENGDDLIIEGRDLALSAPENDLDAGNSGTTIRLLSGVLAAQPFQCRLGGDRYLNKRPMKRIIDPLSLMGAKIESESGRPPLAINGGPLKPIDYQLPVASAQVKSAILLAGLQAHGETTVIETHPSRDHTERLLPAFGVPVRKSGSGPFRISVDGPASLAGCNLTVPGDISSAAYLIGLAVALPDSEIIIRNVGLNPTRTAFLSLLQSAGADLNWETDHLEAGEPVGDITARSSRLKAFTVTNELVPGLIDEIPLLALLATQADGETVISGAAELRVKETDRIAATVECLAGIGADVDETADGLIVRGPTDLTGGAQVGSHGDHRIAMTMTVAGAISRKAVTITDAGWVNISFPGFFSVIESLSSNG